MFFYAWEILNLGPLRVPDIYMHVISGPDEIYKGLGMYGFLDLTRFARIKLTY